MAKRRSRRTRIRTVRERAGRKLERLAARRQRLQQELASVDQRIVALADLVEKM